MKHSTFSHCNDAVLTWFSLINLKCYINQHFLCFRIVTNLWLFERSDFLRFMTFWDNWRLDKLITLGFKYLPSDLPFNEIFMLRGEERWFYDFSNVTFWEFLDTLITLLMSSNKVSIVIKLTMLVVSGENSLSHYLENQQERSKNKSSLNPASRNSLIIAFLISFFLFYYSDLLNLFLLQIL